MSSAPPRAGRLDVIVLTAIALVAGFGVLLAATLAERADASFAAPTVLVLVAVAAAAPGVLRLAAARRHRIELARLRGAAGPAAGLRAVCGLVVAAMLGTAIGALLAQVGADRIVDQIAPTDPAVQVPASAWLLAAATACALGLLPMAAAVPLARAPMAELVLPPRVRRESGRLVVVLRALLVVIAAVAVYQARSVGGEWRAVAALGLAALGCGVLADVCVRWFTARSCGAITKTGALRPEVALRRIGHPSRGATAFVVPVVAAAVIATVVAAGWSTANAWREDTTRIALGGPIRYTAADGPLTVLAAARQADPDAQWLMPMATFRDDPDGSDRRVYVDTERWDRVSASFLSGTAVDEVNGGVDKLEVGEAVKPLTGDRMSFDLDAPNDLIVFDFTIRVAYTNDEGDFVNVELPVTDARGHGDIDAGVSLRIDDCTTACAVSTVSFGGAASKEGVPFAVGPFMLGDTDVWDTADWQRQAKSAGRFEPTDAGLDVTLAVAEEDPRLTMAGSIPVTRGDRELVLEATSSATLPVIAAGDQTAAKEAKLIDGAAVPVEVVATSAALPVIGAAGTMFDLSRALTGHAHSSVGMETFVLARADTPRAVVDELSEAVDLDAGVTYPDAIAVADRTPAAVETRMMALVGALCVLLALIALLGSTRRLRPELRRESSALHLAGLTTSTVRSIGRWELWLTICWVASAVLMSSWVTGELVLDTLPFVGSARLVAAPTLAMSIGPAVGWAVAVAVLTGLVRWVAINASSSTSAQELR